MLPINPTKKLNDEIMCELQANKLAAQREYQFYTGEANAFMICLDLLDHLKEGDKYDRKSHIRYCR